MELESLVSIGMIGCGENRKDQMLTLNIRGDLEIPIKLEWQPEGLEH